MVDCRESKGSPASELGWESCSLSAQVIAAAMGGCLIQIHADIGQRLEQDTQVVQLTHALEATAARDGAAGHLVLLALSRGRRHGPLCNFCPSLFVLSTHCRTNECRIIVVAIVVPLRQRCRPSLAGRPPSTAQQSRRDVKVGAAIAIVVGHKIQRRHVAVRALRQWCCVSGRRKRGNPASYIQKPKSQKSQKFLGEPGHVRSRWKRRTSLQCDLAGDAFQGTFEQVPCDRKRGSGGLVRSWLRSNVFFASSF